MMESTSTKLLIAIDVGMTCTGVAFAIQNKGMEMPEGHVIQTWPGNSGGTSDKVPTSVYYAPNGRISWGFLTRLEEDQSKVREWFKIFFDPAEYDNLRKEARDLDYLPASHADVKRYYLDFLTKLYSHVKKCLADNVREWSSANIEFLFSVPTTWTKLGLTNEFSRLASSAGFGREGPNHQLQVSLTEAEAAAVYTFNSQNALYSDQDVFLVVDAGGGTTDIALMKVHDKSDGSLPSLKSLDEVRGDEIGSVEIDLAFADLAERRMRPFTQQLGLQQGDIRGLAEKMVRNDFRACKEEFGTEDSMSRLDFRISIPGMSESFTLSDAGVTRGKLEFSHADIQALFDQQLVKMYRLIDYQMKRMDVVAPDDRITHFVLSGGLGSSQYIKDRLIYRYTVERVNRRAPELRVISATRPQLSVVKGLILDRMQKVKRRKSILISRACRQSLGVLCFQEYNATRKAHQQVPLIKDPIDNKMYAKDQIVWFVRQGKVIESESAYIDHEFFRTFQKNSIVPWVSQIVISNSRLKSLPDFKKEGDGIKVLCTMKSDLTAVPQSEFEKHKKHWWQSSSKARTHYRARYTIRFLLNPATVDSQLLFKGREYNKPNSFEVVWEAGANMSAPKEHRRSDGLDYDRRL